jgi:hypothetical protein
VEVSSENFNEGKRPTAAPPKSDFKVVARDGNERDRGLTTVFDDFEIEMVTTNPVAPAERKSDQQ